MQIKKGKKTKGESLHKETKKARCPYISQVNQIKSQCKAIP